MGWTGSYRQLGRDKPSLRLPEDQAKQGLALAVLLILTGLAIAGPTGLLAWNENAVLLDQREAEIAVLLKERSELRNRVELLDPSGADRDLSGELVRRHLGVMHPDEVVITLEDE